jgi:hypothetical protein
VENCSLSYRTLSACKKHFQRDHQEFLNHSNQDITLLESSLEQSIINSAEENPRDGASVDVPDLPLTSTELVQKLQSDITQDIISFHVSSKENFLLSHSSALASTRMCCEILKNFSCDLQDLMSIYVKETFSHVLDANTYLPELDFTSLIDQCFEKVSSKHCLTDILRTHFAFVSPVQQLSFSGTPFQYISVKENIQALFKNEMFAKSALSNNSPFFQSPYYNRYMSPLFEGEAVNPIYLSLYSDEIELCNPIGVFRRKHKVSMFYYQILNIDYASSSQLNAFHLLCIAKYSTVQTDGYDCILRPFVEEMLSLFYDGISLSHNTCVPVVLAYVCGDNKTLHHLLGLSQCFSYGYICRQCVINRVECDTKCDDFNMRTHEAYHSDCLQRINGCQNMCILMQLPYLRFPDAFPPDFMHDFLEGVSHLVVSCVFHHLLVNGYQTLETLNARLTAFEYVVKICEIKRDYIRNQHFPFSASQMLHVVQHLPLLFGDCISQDDSIWELLIIHNEIVYHLYAPSFHAELCDTLRTLILTQFRLINLHCPIKKYPCKRHYIMHYSHILEQIGPLRLFWTMRFESVHQYFKRMATIQRQFKNITYSLAHRFQSRLSVMLSQPNFFHSVHSSPSFETIVLAALPLDVSCVLPMAKVGDTCNSHKWLIMNAFKYKPSECIILGVEDGGELSLGIITHIIHAYSVFFLVCSKYKAHYIHHLRAYQLEMKTSPVINIPITPGSEVIHPPLQLHSLNDALYVVLQHVICQNGNFSL